MFSSLHKNVSYDVENDYLITVTGSDTFNLLIWDSNIEEINPILENGIIFIFEFKLQNLLKEFNEKFSGLDPKSKNEIEFTFNEYMLQQSYRLIAFKVQTEKSQKEIFTYFRPIIFSEMCSKENFYNEIVNVYSSLIKDIKLQSKDFETRIKVKFYPKYGICFGCGSKDCKGCYFTFQDQTLFDTIQYYESKSGIDFLSSILLFEIYFPIDQFEKLSTQMNMCKLIKNKKANDRTLNLYSCLDKLTMTEVLSDDNKWKCVNCKNEVNSFKKVMLYKTPKILIIAIKRFKLGDSLGEKITTLVDFPLKDLNLSLYINNKVDNANKYNLISVIYH